MAELTGEPIVTAEQLAVEDQAEADTPANVDDHRAFLMACRPELKFGKSDDARVVLDVRWRPSRGSRSLRWFGVELKKITGSINTLAPEFLG